LAVVGLGARVGGGRGADDLRRAVLQGEQLGRADVVEVDLAGLRVPPHDVALAAPQQLLVLEAAREAVVGLDLPRERTHVVVGAGLDLTPARAGARWRAPQWLADAGLTDAGLPGLVADAFDGPAVPARAVGALPNLLANRIGTHLDLGGPGYVVAAEERSGLLALEQAARALRRGAADAVLVGAVDTSCDPVHQQALRDLGSTERPGDGAVVLVLKRLDDARRDGDPVLAVLPGDADVVAPELVVGEGPEVDYDAVQALGAAYAARDLIAVAAAVVALRAGVVPAVGAPGTPRPGLRSVRVTGAGGDGVVLHAQEPEPVAAQPVEVPGSRTVSVPVHPGLRLPPTPREVAEAPARPGPSFDRAQLEHLSTGRVSGVLGPAFAALDDVVVQTRMPAPPLLLADRVTGIDADAGVLAVPEPAPATGTLWTETDVRADSWYLDATGRMPAGLMIEAGQADLLLISWLGVDLVLQGSRRYRLLGCELTYAGSRPRVGETLRFEIHVDGHARHGDVWLFFFHYDCWVGDELRLQARNGQAGYFTTQELAAAEGVQWDPAACEPDDRPLDPAPLRCSRSAFGGELVRAFAEGDAATCYGPGWERAAEHVRTPRIDDGSMLLLGRVTDLDPAGGPWGRGYVRAETAVSPDDWFFAGHFTDDPCMAGTLMLQGCLQAMAFYLTATGATLDRDGWRFDLAPGHRTGARCRGQVTPSSQQVVYEVFVHGLSLGPVPTLYADVLGSVDGVRAFHGRDVALQLVPDDPPTGERP
ncbi:beta-ketoacyl synthase N-terminal-like domain-containing protein, partial [Angustibacter aerolatus]